MTTKPTTIYLSVVIPCLNEAESIRQTVKVALAGIKKAQVTGEVLVVDNGSTDNSVAIATKAGAHVLLCPTKGYGAALRFGFRHAKGKILLMGDADGSYDFSAIPQFLEKIRAGFDLVIGSRLHGAIETGAMPFLHRYLGTPVLTTILNIFFGAHFSDCNSGMRALTKSTFRKLRLEADGMEFASEMLVKASILHVQSTEIPIPYKKDLRKTHRPHLHTWRDGWFHLRFLILYAPDKIFAIPGLFWFLLGSILVFTQLKQRFSFQRFHLDFHIMILGVFIGIFGLTLMQMGIGLELLSKKRGYKVGFINDFLQRTFNLEKFLTIGIGIFLFGFGIDLYILIQWIKLGFDKVIYWHQAVAATYCMSVGIELVFFAVFYTILITMSFAEN